MKKIFSLILACVLLVGCVFTFASCAKPNSDPDKAKEALEEAGYEVMLNDSALNAKDVEATLIAMTKDGENYLVVVYYEDKDAANEAWEDAQEDAKELEEEYEDVICKKSGKMIYYGTKEAAKAAR